MKNKHMKDLKDGERRQMSRDLMTMEGDGGKFPGFFFFSLPYVSQAWN